MRGRMVLVAVISIVFFWVFSCQGEAEDKTLKASGEEHSETHVHSEEHQEAGHMEHMSGVREWLKEELGEEYGQPVPEATDQQVALGKEVYQKSCVMCHGTSGRGDGPAAAAFPSKPADFTDPEHSTYYSDRGRIFIIQKGIKGTPMVGFENSLSEEEIGAVYAYVRSLRASEEMEHGHEHEEHRH